MMMYVYDDVQAHFFEQQRTVWFSEASFSKFLHQSKALICNAVLDADVQWLLPGL